MKKRYLLIILIALFLARAPQPAYAVPPAQEDDPKAQADALFNEGNVLLQNWQLQAALLKFEQALPLYQEANDRPGEALCLLAIGFTKEQLADYAGALEAYQVCLPIWHELGERVRTGTTLNNTGGIYHRLGQYEEALGYFQRALSIAREIGDRAGEGISLNNIGGIYYSLGQYEEALGYFQQALDIHRQVRNHREVGESLNNVGGIYYNLGQYEEALGYFQQALSIAREIGDRAGEGVNLNNVGRIYDSLGQYQEALRYYEQSLAIRREIGDRAGEGVSTNNIGLIYHSLGQYEEALGYYEQALSIRREIGDRAGEGESLNNIGGIYHSLGQYEEALGYYEQVLAIDREIGNCAGEGNSLNNIGGIYSNLVQYEEALGNYEQALAIRREIGDRAGEEVSLNNIGSIYHRLGQYEEALAYYEQAVSVTEAMRSEMTVEEFKSDFATERVHVYDGIVSLLIKMNRPQDAFGYTQRAKARTLLDQLGNVRINPTAADEPALIQQEEQLRHEIQALDKQIREEWAKPQDQRSDEAIQSLAARLEIKRAEYERLLPILKLNNPEYVSLVTVDPLSLHDLQRILTDMTLIEYYVIGDRTLAFIVTQDEFHSVSISTTQESLIKTFQSLYDFPSLEDVPRSVRDLYQTLIAPLESYFNTDLVVIAPHNVLHYVPFGALHDGEHYLAEKHTLFIIPSASVLPFAFEKRKTSVSNPLILGDPDDSLPNGRREAQAIAHLYGTTAHIGGDALERWLWEQGSQAGILHLSTHGVYNARSPLFSYVLLAGDDEEDGRLEVYEIYNRGLNLENADLVVLSACQTNLGELSRGDEIVGLSRALIYVGAPSVVSSLWSVNDKSTRVLMERFYTYLHAGMSKAGALRQAQMEMIASEEYSHPYYWAAFVLTGDPGAGELTQAVQAITVPTPTPEKQSGGLCPAVMLPLAFLIVVSVGKHKWRERA